LTRLSHGATLVRMKSGLTVLVLSILAASCTTSTVDQDVPPVVIHAKQPDRLYPDWDTDAIFATFDAACPKGDQEAGEQSWRMQDAIPSPNDAGTVVPDKMTGIVTCADGSRQQVVIHFDRS
jgi:hypothetical protein